MKKITTKQTSQILQEIIDSFEDDGILTVREFLDRLGNRAKAMAILVFSLSAVIAGAIPGFSTIMAIPIMFIALQMMAGRKVVWLPKNIADKNISPRIIRGALVRSISPLQKLEKFLRPRLLILTHPYIEQGLALIIFMLAGILSLPIPAGNFLPSMGISILALAILERDGYLIVGAVAMIALTGGVMIELIHQAYTHLMQLLHWLF